MKFHKLLCGLGVVILTLSVSRGETFALKVFGMDLDDGTILQMLAKGEAGLVENQDDGSLKLATGMILLHAPAEKAWAFITDYDAYPATMPNIKRCHIAERHDGEPKPYLLVDFDIDVPLKNPKYRLKVELDGKERIVSTWVSGDLEGTYNEIVLHPVHEGRDTIVAYALYSPLREQSWIMKQLINSNPTIEHGVNLATALVTLRGFKKGVEGPGKP